MGLPGYFIRNNPTYFLRYALRYFHQKLLYPTFYLILLLPLTTQALVINEFMAANNNAVADPQGEYDDWIELYNESSRTVDVAGMYLTDDLNEPTKWRFPYGLPTQTQIKTRKFLVIWADQDSEDGGVNGLHAGFSLRSTGEEIALFNTDGTTLVDRVVFGRQATDLSYGRYRDGKDTWQIMDEPTPGAKNRSGLPGKVADPEVSVTRGFYDTAQTVNVSTTTPRAEIWITLDGTQPHQYLGGGRWTGFKYSSPLTISETTCLHAVAVRNGWLDSTLVSHTYLFPSQIIQQSSQPPGFPSSWGKNKVDYAMDPGVVNDPAYRHTIEQDLQTIPSVCLSLDNDELFDSKDGIYANARQHGPAWERFVSFEWIDPLTGQQFCQNAGLRVHGGAGRSSGVAKHALRLIFKNEYGPARLSFPLFEDSEVTTFNSLVLRAGWNYSWIGHSGMGGPKHAQYLRDPFARDIMRDLNHLVPHSRHVHLYINGLYWGLYVFCERPDDGFAAAHLGGSEEDYDVLKASNSSSSGTTMELLAGDREAWNTLFALCEQNLNSLAAYERIQEYVDIPALIDYMLMVFYVGSRDAPTLLYNDYYPRNFYALRRRNPPGPFYFQAWDVEWCLESTNEDRVSKIGGIDNPGRVFQALGANQQFKRQVADRIFKLFLYEGPLTPEASQQRYGLRCDEIDRAIVGESARWGDAKRAGNAYTRDRDWVTERNRIMDQYFPARTNIVLNQLRNRKWYPSVDAPIFKINSKHQQGGHVAANAKLRLDLPSGSATYYYTLDGSDPLLPDGDLSQKAVRYSKTITLTRSIHIKARAYKKSEWSALNEAVFAVGPIADSLRISEIMYHPQDPNAEFIELTNIGSKTIYLDHLRFTDGIRFTFGPTELKRKQHLLLVRDQAVYNRAYGQYQASVVGQYEGRLDNDGDRLRLEDALGQTLFDFRYDDSWEPRTDGEGYSLVPVNEKTDPADYENPARWKRSRYRNGSPGRAD